MRNLKLVLAGSGLSAMMAVLGGCESANGVQDAPDAKARVGATDLTGSSPFDRELIAAKNGSADPVEKVRAMTAVLDRYGIAHPPADELDAAPPVAGPAAKVARSWNPVRRDFTSSLDVHTYKSGITVSNGSFARFAALGNTDNVDAFIVAYYMESSADPTGAFKVRVVGYNDDVASDNRNAVMTWTNNTGSSKFIEVVAFAYATSTRGKGLISITANGTTNNYPDREIGGLKRFGANPLPAAPGDCVQPLLTQLKLWSTSGGESVNVLVVDTKAMRGGSLQIQTIVSEPVLNLPWIVDNPYPSFALIYRGTRHVLDPNWADRVTPSQSRFTQTDRYGCVE